MGANDGLLSTGSLMLGVAAAHAPGSAILLAGCSALVAGTISMAAGEYVSVSSQADIERADLEAERRGLDEDPDAEHAELAAIYVERGLSEALALEVAHQLMAHDALGAHARDEIGITDSLSARPIHAAAVSAVGFSLGAVVPILLAWIFAAGGVALAICAGSLIALAALGALAALVGGADPVRGSLRVVLWGAFAMIGTSVVGHLFNVVG